MTYFVTLYVEVECVSEQERIFDPREQERIMNDSLCFNNLRDRINNIK